MVTTAERNVAAQPLSCSALLQCGVPKWQMGGRRSGSDRTSSNRGTTCTTARPVSHVQPPLVMDTLLTWPGVIVSVWDDGPELQSSKTLAVSSPFPPLMILGNARVRLPPSNDPQAVLHFRG